MPSAGGGAQISSSGQIAAGAVTSEDILDDEIVDADIDAAAAIAGSKLADVVHDTGNETVAGVKTFSSDPLIPDEAYGAGWNGVLEPPTKNAVYDKIEAVASPWTTVKKAADETITLSTTFQDDDELLFAMAANTYYIVRGTIFFLESANPGIKFQFTGPAAPNAVQGIGYGCGGAVDSDALTVSSGPSYTTIIPIFSAGNGNGTFHFEMLIKNGVNAGNLVLQWAQQTSDAADTSVYKGSHIEYMAVA